VRKYVGMDERTAFRTVSRPALFRNFHLQAGNLAATSYAMAIPGMCREKISLGIGSTP